VNIPVTQKLIKEMCGTVSFKRGDYFYRTNKVVIEQYLPDRCLAVVQGEENFYVTIEVAGGGLKASCTCPKLASYHKDCQHIAAVLTAISERQRQAGNPQQELTAGVLNLFHDSPVPSSGHQRYFEKRDVLEVEFNCRPVTSNGRQLIGMRLKIEDAPVQHIRPFLEQVSQSRPYPVTSFFTYDTARHCFETENDAVIQELIHVIHDEKAIGGPLSSGDHPELVVLPSTAWEKVLPLLQKAPKVKLEHEGRTYPRIHVTDHLPPLEFAFTEKQGTGYQLKVDGFANITILDSYSAILHDGKITQLDQQDFQRMLDLKQLLSVSGTSEIPIPSEQIRFFLEKTAQGLKRLGQIIIADSLAKKWMNTPLKAKLYLDRVKNLLLAGLEFHYDHVVINPLEDSEPPSSMVVRDIEKEAEIIQLMEASSFAKSDEGYYMHNEDLEYEFLYHTVPKLQKLVQIYATTAVRNRIFRGGAQPQIRIKVKKERTNWLEFKFEMDGIGEQQIRDVLEALEEKRKYYRLPNGSLMSLETREIEEIQQFLRSPFAQNKDIANGLDLPLEQCLQMLDTVEVSDGFKLDESFRQFLDTLHHPDQLEFEVPSSLEPILKDYQKTGYKWMKSLAHYSFGGILADDMGLGKTIQSIAFIVSVLPEVRKQRQPVLVICPSSLTYNWLSEIKKFAPELRAAVIDGNQAERTRRRKEAADIDVLITSYPLLRRDMTWFEKQFFHTVFFDEAQAFKNPLTQTARAVKRLQANHRFALTGTPVENSLEELWSIFHIVFPLLFRGLKDYSQLSRKTIARRIRPFLLRRLKEDVLAELPGKIEALDTVELFPEQKKLYAAYLAKLRHDTLKHLDKETIRKNRIRILAGLTRLRQICCHPGLFVDGYKGSSAKLEQLMRIIEESRKSGRRVLIFSQFTKMLELIGRRLAAKGLTFFYLDGQTPSEERVEICNRFNQGERNLFLISLKAGGTGLNLAGADTVILYDTWWNPAVEEQAADRAHRMGQVNTVQVIKLVARGTIEEKMNELQDKKRNLIEEVIDSDEKMMAGLTEDDIREILLY